MFFFDSHSCQLHSASRPWERAQREAARNVHARPGKGRQEWDGGRNIGRPQNGEFLWSIEKFNDFYSCCFAFCVHFTRTINESTECKALILCEILCFIFETLRIWLSNKISEAEFILFFFFFSKILESDANFWNSIADAIQTSQVIMMVEAFALYFSTDVNFAFCSLFERFYFQNNV